MSKAVQVSNLHLKRGDFELKNISVEIRQGTLCGLLGANGSGKSTFFNCCMNFLNYDSGEILINQENIKGKSYAWMAKNVSYVAQNLDLNFPFRVKDIVLMGRSIHAKSMLGPNEYDKQRCREAMQFVGVLHLQDKIITQLSGGQRQLVFIARALAQETPIMFLDEPTSALDFKNQILLWKILKKISDDGKTIIICTHEPNHVLWFCDEVIAFKDGNLLAKGLTKEIINKEFLDKIYDKTCKLINLEELNIILPN